MAQSSYVIRGGLAGRERLRMLAGVMLPTTRGLLERAGVRSGMACLDVGCGGGDGSFVLAQLVGHGGRVLGIDLDATKIDLARREATQMQLPQIEFRVAAAGAGAADELFDVVYARFLLTHLTDPGAVVRDMFDRLRPGGMLIVEDIDFRGHFCEPPLRAFTSYLEWYSAVVQARGADPNIGPRLPGLLLDAGCEGVEVHVVQPAGIAGDVKRLAAVTMENVAEAILAAGLATPVQLDSVIAELTAAAEDGRTLMSLPRIVQTWGRRAESAA